MILFFFSKFNKIDENIIFLRSNILSEFYELVCLENNIPKCPRCNTSKHFVNHCSYVRNICSIVDSKIISTTIEILRLKCNSCGQTHALLPDDVIPYCYYGKSFVMHCLKLYYIDNKNVSEIVSLTNTYEKLIYKFLKIYSGEFCSLMFFLKSYLSIYLETKTPPRKIFSILNSIENFKNFLKEYFSSTNRVFLMRKRQNIISRKNLIGYHSCKYMGFT